MVEHRLIAAVEELLHLNGVYVWNEYIKVSCEPDCFVRKTLISKITVKQLPGEETILNLFTKRDVHTIRLLGDLSTLGSKDYSVSQILGITISDMCSKKPQL